MGGTPKTGPLKFKLFKFWSKIHEIFKVSKHKGKIKFFKLWRYQKGGPPIGPPKFKLFNHFRLTNKVFSVGKYEEELKFDKIWRYKN